MITKIFIRLFSTFLYIFSWALYLMYLSDIFYGIPGYYFSDVLVYRYIWVIPIILVISLFLDNNVRNISDLILLGSVYIVFFPLIYLSFSNATLLIVISISTLFTVLGWRLLKNTNFIKKEIVSKFVRFKYSNFLLLIIIFVILFVNYLGVKLRLNYKSSLYEVRSEFKESFSGLSVYILILSEYFIIPLCMYSFFKTNKRFFKILFFIMGLFFSIQVFFHSAIKSSLFIIPFLILGYLFLRKKDTFDFYKFLFLFSILLILFIQIKPGGIIGYLGNHSLRRFINAPPVNAYYHFLYTIEHYGWINIGNRKDMGNQISRFYYESDGNAPSGLLADAFSRFGTLGLLLFPPVFLIFLVILRNLTKNLKLSEQFILFGYYLYVLTNASFITSQITYGLFLMILSVYLLNKEFVIKSRRGK